MLIGPVLNDIHALGLAKGKTVIATAFYTAGPLRQLQITSGKAIFAVRLDRNDLTQWIDGSIDPAALARTARKLVDQGTSVEISVSKIAHAKFYVGNDAALIGSANLTTRGLAGLGNEAMCHIPLSAGTKTSIQAGLSRYLKSLQPITLNELEEFVAQNTADVLSERRKRKIRDTENRPPKVEHSDRPVRIGTYESFLAWLGSTNTDAAREILERAKGKNNLSGHIYRNFFGLRQYLIHAPANLKRFTKESEDEYKLSKDTATEEDLKDFVQNHAFDEDKFSLDTWKTYLPQECGGRAEKHGGTIGNLNRMLPLVAKHLAKKLRSSK